MTDEEKAEKWIKGHSGLIAGHEFIKYDYDSMQQAYLAGLHKGRSEVIEEKDKQIEELKAQLNEERQLHKLFQPCV